MVELDDYFECLEPIDINKYLKEINIPNRIVNVLRLKKFYSEEQFFKEVDNLLLKHTSHYLFPNELVSFYPQVREYKANHELICHLSGSIIKKGSFYYAYHPFMEVLNNGRIYTIKSNINAELAFIDYFPQDLFTYEEWYYKLKNAYYSKDDNIIDFYHLSSVCGESCLDPYLLGQGKKKRKK